MSVGKIIREARVANKMTQQALADLLGVSRVTVSLWESGQTAPTRKNAPAVISVLGLADKSLDLILKSGVSTVDQPPAVSHISLLSWDGISPQTVGALSSIVPSATVMIDSSADVAELYALSIEDDSMGPEFGLADIVIVHRSLVPNSNDAVIVVAPDGSRMLRTYVPRGRDRTGQVAFDLVASNPDFPTFSSNSSSPAVILGVVVEHRRKLRR